MPDVHDTAPALDRAPADSRHDAGGPRLPGEIADLATFGAAHAE